ncbi:FtsK/SpoIIIE domain-containing protein [Microbispora siamensis]|uniref:FtsK domain-containing protein n=1 Tax=Microbispora siamensis TaxID=564413 RepID=A0ABQ4GRD8_9ACTN|nr:FtsK/SpoIIIE domain-containing protein [Microbispora siamensis]GIH63990.1 hypothetical protein Msi02_48070 [Microbispora siamensis]
MAIISRRIDQPNPISDTTSPFPARPSQPHAPRTVIRWDRSRVGAQARVTVRVASAPVMGTGRLASVAWRWVRADDYAGATDFKWLESIRKRRRRTAGVMAGAYALATTYGASMIGGPGALAVAVSTVLGVGTAVEVRKRIKDRPAPMVGDTGRRAAPREQMVVQAAVAAKLGKEEGMRLAKPIVKDGLGWSTVLQLPPGDKARKCLGMEGNFASALGVGETQVVFDLVDGHAGQLVIFVAESDPFLQLYPSPLTRQRAPLDFWQGVPAGINGRGNEERLRLVEASLLVAGEPRAGKSAAVNGIIGAAALAVTPKIHLFDGKGAGDHRPWRKIAHTAVKRNAPALLAHLQEMQAQMERVFDLLDEHGGGTKLTPELCRRFGVDVELTVVDETRYYVTSPQGDEIVDAMVDIASRGPAAGILLVLASQRMTTDAIPGPLKGVCSLRWAMRCPDTTASNAVLGQGAAGAGYNASEIPRTHRGVGILDADGDDPVKLRSYFLDDPDLVAVAEVAYELRRAAGTLPVHGDAAEITDDLASVILAAIGERDRIHTEDLIASLGAGWDAARIATALRPYGVTPGPLKIGGINRQGYRRDALEAALLAA